MAPRSSDSSYHCEPLAALARQAPLAPASSRQRQVRQAEQLHDMVEPDATYPLDFVLFRVTGYRSDGGSDTLLVGEALRADLRQLIDDLTRHAPQPPDPAEPCETVASLAERFSVATKTVRRWRGAGLRSRWAVMPGHQRPQLVFTQSAIEHFQQSQGQRVERASAFTHLSTTERDAIIARARRIAEAVDVSLNRVAAHLARKYDRALETMRQLLEQHDRRHPESLIFADRTGPLTVQQRRVIARALRMGVSISTLTRRFNRTRSTIYRAARRRRASAVRRVPIQAHRAPTFDLPEADEVLLRDLTTELPTDSVSAVPGSDLPTQLQPVFRQPVLKDAAMHRLAVQMNYLLDRAGKRRDGLDRYEPRVADLDAIERDLETVGRLRANLIRVNLPTVLTIARQHLADIADRSRASVLLTTLLEIGVPVLIEAVDTYDPFRGRSLPRHVQWLLMRRFAASIAGMPQMLAWARHQAGRAQRREPSLQAVQHILTALRAANVLIELPDATELSRPEASQTDTPPSP